MSASRYQRSVSSPTIAASAAARAASSGAATSARRAARPRARLRSSRSARRTTARLERKRSARLRSSARAAREGTEAWRVPADRPAVNASAIDRLSPHRKEPSRENHRQDRRHRAEALPASLKLRLLPSPCRAARPLSRLRSRGLRASQPPAGRQRIRSLPGVRVVRPENRVRDDREAEFLDWLEARRPDALAEARRLGIRSIGGMALLAPLRRLFRIEIGP